jgi:N-acetylglucosaminyldiphosphoundecaprenol N-acetyl-beta-D-mannosaminyltransferase
MAVDCKMLGVRVDALKLSEVRERIEAAVAAREPRLLGGHNLHSVYLYQRNPDVRAFYDAAHIVPSDSMALILLARLLGYRVTRDHRTTPLDWIDSVLDAAVQNNWRVFYYGSRPGVIDRSAEEWRRRHPGLQLALAQGPPRGCLEADNAALLEKIRAWSPHILFVGLGQPRQEKWAMENWRRTGANVTIMAGALLDYASGAVPMPPRWIGRLGFEWLFRLLSEPRWLWRRYLIEPWFLLGLAARDLSERVQGRGGR